ncbi:uncharacterized protein KY384_002416 [Bacidia gigantensis]|uniref:uncharacterized protein n=1 Tax=Bacidia gigantensis TaxID=2732470 RepID=UPI001D04257B|nr:uncharacterized protein KY384_002416 [Bacidia gigantensis]KAG8532539.1 hypothetical protein KY384_002416 [Bacidia gigantensis]
MADDANATKAPESDAHEPSVISQDDTPAQTGASMGELSKISDIDVYIAKPSDYPHLPSKLLLYLSSGTGIHSKNNQLQADKYASKGFLVVMPDHSATDENGSIIEKVKMGLATTAKSFVLDMWLARQTPEKVLPVIHKVIDGAKEEFADAVANGGGIYAVGYCFGGKYVCILGSELPDTVAHGQAIKDEEQGIVKTGPLIKCGALAHGTLITKEDLEAIKAPISFVAVENDQLFPDDIRTAGKERLEKDKVEHEMKVYSDVPHGFATVGEYEDPKIQEAQKAAFEQMTAWLQAH